MIFRKDMPAEGGYYWAVYKETVWDGGAITGYKWSCPEVVEVGCPNYAGLQILLSMGAGGYDDPPWWSQEHVRFGDRIDVPSDVRLDGGEEP